MPLRQIFVINNSGWWIQGLLTLQDTAGELGCGNSTAQLKAMCMQRTDSESSGFYGNCEWCEHTFTYFVTPSGWVVDACQGKLLNDFNPGVNGNQCRSTYFDGIDAKSAFQGGEVKFSTCQTGPDKAYQTEAQLPEWCNCSSEAFDLIVSGTPYCQLNARRLASRFQDPEPVKVPRDFAEPGSGFLYSAQRVPQFIKDDWKDYVGWRIGVAAPPALDVGAMGGYLRSNGFLGNFEARSNASSFSRAPVEAKVSVSGLISKLPRGLAFDEPETPDLWADTRSCSGNSEMLTCCANSTRREVKLPEAPWFGAVPCFVAVEETQANALPWYRTFCKPCGDMENTHSEQPLFFPFPDEVYAT